jgi:hypothetical protein
MTAENPAAPAKDQPAVYDALLDAPVWGAEGIGEVANKNTSQTFRMLEEGLIDGSKVGRQWTSTRRRILKSIGAL